MATCRDVPTTLFSSHGFFEWSSNTTCLMLIGIILDADDEGRGSAHSVVLARTLHQEVDQIENALVELEQHRTLQCYEIAGQRYYILCHRHTYQATKKPPSPYPAPPAERLADTSQDDPGND